MNLGEGYTVSQAYRVFELPRSSYYDQDETNSDQQADLKAVLQLAAQWSVYGYRRLIATCIEKSGLSTASECGY